MVGSCVGGGGGGEQTPATIVLVDNCEFNLYRINEELQLLNEHGANICPLLIDVTDGPRMQDLMQWKHFNPTNQSDKQPQFVQDPILKNALSEINRSRLLSFLFFKNAHF